MEISPIQQLMQAVKSVTAGTQSQNFPPIKTETRSAANTDCAAYDVPIPSMQELLEFITGAPKQRPGPTPSTKGTRPTAVKHPHDFPPLDQETRSHVETECAAFHLNRKGQTLRAWACLENGPIRPTRINGRLAWAVADIKRLLNGGV